MASLIHSVTPARSPDPAVLFVRKNTIYSKLPNLDLYDIDRNALTFKGTAPVIAHPPCRGWGRLRGLSKATLFEKALAPWSIHLIRKNGGVLEHPECSYLFRYMDLPKGNSIDTFGGWTLSIDQSWFGHRARKRTWLYICGVSPGAIPSYPLSFNAITHLVCSSKRKSGKKELSKAGRMATPLQFAKYLVRIAKIASIHHHY